MGRKVDVDELIDATEVAVVLGLSKSQAVYVYLNRYPDMPRPIIDRGPNRARLWLRPEVEAWARQRS